MPETELTTSTEYREIERLPGYRFGSDGTIRSQWLRGSRKPDPARSQEKRPSMGADGYLYVGLAGKRWNVHRLIAEAFHGPCPPDMECRHLNGDRSDNRAENLAWGTRKENVGDTLRMGRHGPPAEKRPRGSRQGSSKLTEADIPVIRRRVRSGESRAAVARDFGVARVTVRSIISGKAWKHVDDDLMEAASMVTDADVACVQGGAG